MRSKRQKKHNGSPSPFSKQLPLNPPSPFKIKFNLNRDNLACFITQHPIINKRKAPLRPNSRPSQKKVSSQPSTSISKPKVAITSSKMINLKGSGEDIVNESMEIIGEIERKGIDCGWEQQTGEEVNDEGDDKENSQIWGAFSVNQSFQKSYASTMDYFPHHNTYSHVNTYKDGSSFVEGRNINEMKKYNQNQAYRYDPRYDSGYEPILTSSADFSQQSSSFSHSSTQPLFTIRQNFILSDPRTTVMIRNIPNKYTIRQLSDEIDGGLENTYDFLYLPCDIKNQCNVGYGFINFLTVEYLLEFYERFQGKRWSRFRSQKICVLTYARLQGLGSLIEHFENSKVLCQRDRRFRPIIREYARVQHLIKAQQQQ